MTGVGFDSRTGSGLPIGPIAADILAAAYPDGHERELHGTKQVRMALAGHSDRELIVDVGPGDRVSPKWEVRLSEHTRYAKLRSPGGAYQPWHPEWPPEKADLARGFFMAWCIRNGLVGERHSTENAELVEAVQRGELTGREFLYRTAFRGEFWSWDLHSDVREFAHRYFFGICERNSTVPLIGSADEVTLSGDFRGVFDPFFPGRCLDAADDGSNDERFALLLDARWADFGVTGLEDAVFDEEITESQLAQVGAIYARQQALMAALSPSAAADVSAVSGVAPEVSGSQILALLGRDLDNEMVIGLLAAIGGSEWATRAWDRSIPAPLLGLRLDLGYPWELARLESAWNDAAKRAFRRTGRWMITGATVSAEGETALSSTDAVTFSSSEFRGRLPFGLAFDDTLPALDEKFGPDTIRGALRVDDNQTRRWEVTLDGAPWSGDADEPHLLLMVDFRAGAILSLQVAYR